MSPMAYSPQAIRVESSAPFLSELLADVWCLSHLAGFTENALYCKVIAKVDSRLRRSFVTRSSVDSRWQDPEQAESGGSDLFHVAINMDGNGRWALVRGLPREEGHLAGATAVRRTVESAPALGITTLTLYAFSSDNWRRPRGEVDNLMLVLQKYLDSECAHLTDSGVRLSVIGRRDRIPGSLGCSIAHVEERTSEGTSL